MSFLTGLRMGVTFGAANRMLAGLAEIALDTTGLDDFRRNALRMLCPLVGSSSAAFFTSDGVRSFVPIEWPLPTMLQSESARLWSEFRPAEVQWSLSRLAFRDDELFDSRRRDELGVYREFLPSIGVRGFAAGVWPVGRGLTAMTLGFSAGQGFAGRRSATVNLLRLAAPLFRIAERLHASPPAVAVLDASGLTRCERELLALVERGLTNPEIASLRGMSPNTVRNRLVSAFGKLGVSRRAEAGFVMRSRRSSI
jgi:DNA-binding CsgD family transcriptional regulator